MYHSNFHHACRSQAPPPGATSAYGLSGSSRGQEVVCTGAMRLRGTLGKNGCLWSVSPARSRRQVRREAVLGRRCSIPGAYSTRGAKYPGRGGVRRMRPLAAGQWARWIPEAWLRPPRAFPFFGVQLDLRPTLDFRIIVSEPWSTQLSLARTLLLPGFFTYKVRILSKAPSQKLEERNFENSSLPKSVLACK